MLNRRDRARPAGQGRRLLGMVFGTWFLVIAAGVGGNVSLALFTLRVEDPQLSGT